MQNHEILVSIGVSAYNCARFLETALTSAFGQTHRNIEVLFYNDGSTDETLELARSFSDPRLTIIDVSRNSGVGVARQVIKTLARGAYLTWLDTDDLFHPERVDILLKAALASGADLVCDNARFIDEQGGPLPGEKRIPDAVADDPCFTRIFERNAMIPHPLISRRCFTQVDYDLSLTTSEDYDYWLKCSHAGFRFQRVDQALLDYRFTSGSLSSDPAKSRQAVARIFSKYSVAQLRELYAERGFTDAVINYMACLQHIFRSQYTEALACAVEPWPQEDNIDLAFYRGTLELFSGSTQAAERYLRRHLEQVPDSPAGYNNLGILLRRQEKNADSCWQRALELFPSYSDALKNLAGEETFTFTQLQAARHR